LPHDLLSVSFVEGSYLTEHPVSLGRYENERAQMKVMRVKFALSTASVVLVLAAGITAPLTTTTVASAAASGTMISTRSGAYGAMLDVGSGKYAGYTVYMITSDQPPTFGCTTKPINLFGMPIACTGPSNDQKAEWPAVTTTGSPKAGPGVSQKLLGTVKRAGIGEQVTYAGHPLYLFETSPDQITGEGWDEPSIPPWSGLWYLVSASGEPLPWPGTLTTTTAGNKTVLGALEITLAGWEVFPLYSFSGDTSSASNCTGTCSVAWPPVLTSGNPALLNSLSSSKVGTIKDADGELQLTYGGKPLYFYSKENVIKGPNGFEATGSGNGVKAPSPATGTFSFVTP
jgi:predicted lipoprotein with Yx(FWY)xxD motif